MVLQPDKGILNWSGIKINTALVCLAPYPAPYGACNWIGAGGTGPMLRIGRLADYALLIVDCLAKQPEQLTTEAIANHVNVPLATVRKLLKLLVDAGLLRSQRGLKGGYRLARDPGRISVADVIRAVEGPVGLTQCAQDEHNCELSSDCELKENWHFINDIIQQQLERITIADMGGDMRAAAEQRIPLVSVSS